MTADKFNYYRIKAMEERIKELETVLDYYVRLAHSADELGMTRQEYDNNYIKNINKLWKQNN